MSDEKPEVRGIVYIFLSALAFLFGWSLSKLRATGQMTADPYNPGIDSDKKRTGADRANGPADSVTPTQG
jgi:hypothetical protein